MLSKKYYKAFAEIIRTAYKSNNDFNTVLINELISFFKQDNGNFDEDKFKEAIQQREV